MPGYIFPFSSAGSGVGGSGTINRVPKFTPDGTTLGDSNIFDDGTTVGVGIAGTDGTLHVHTATAGVIAAISIADDLVVENSGAGGMTILTPDASDSSFFFGSTSDANGAGITWNFDTKVMEIGTLNASGTMSINTANGAPAITIDTSQGVTFSGRVLGSDGTAALPSFAWTSDDDGSGTGFYRSAANEVAVAINGNASTIFSSGAIRLQDNSGSLRLGTSQDVRLYRNAAGDAGIQHGTSTSSAAWNVYNTSNGGANPTNFESVKTSWSGNDAFFETIAGGTGSARKLVLKVPAGQIIELQPEGGASQQFKFQNAAFWAASATTDLGLIGTPFRTLYLGTSIRHGTTVGITAGTTQTQAGATALTTEANEVATVGTTADGVKLPTAAVGWEVWVVNNGANSLNLYPATSDNLGAGVDTAVALAASANVTYKAIDATNWVAVT